MASLNLSTNGSSITKSYQSVINAPPASSAASNSPTYGQWAVFSVSTPLVNAFQSDSSGKEAVLKVQTTGEGELTDLIDEFSDGKVQFAFVKVKDSNSGLPKHVYICWCGEGVPERTKGYFANYQLATAKILHGYHVQITARSDRDLTPESIIQQVAQASGSNYSRTSAPQSSKGPPPVASKPAFMPTSSGATSGAFNPLGARRSAPSQPQNVDADGWGDDAPPVTRTQLEKVAPAYQPTKVSLRDSSSQQSSTSFQPPAPIDRPDVVKGAYQPIGKVDIAAIRRQAQESSSTSDDRPTIVKGAYEPVGKVDIAAIRARAQQPQSTVTSTPSNTENDNTPKSLAERSAAFNQSERLTELPKPRVANKFGSSTSSFTGTKAPLPGAFGLESQKSPTNAGLGSAGRSFADSAGKTPAQLWAEKKAREGGTVPSATVAGARSPSAETSGNEWKSGYTGKTWNPVQTTKTGQSAGSFEAQRTGEQQPQQEDESESAGGVSSLRDRFKDVNITRTVPSPPSNYERAVPEPPVLETSNKPNAGRGVPIPGLAQDSSVTIPPPPAQPRSPTPPTPDQPESPIRVAVPVSRNIPEVEDAHEEQHAPPPALPVASLAKQVSQHEQDDEPDVHDPARDIASTVATTTFGEQATEVADGAARGGKTATALYDYEKIEDNELELHEGERIINIDMVDVDWWMGENSRGETGYFPKDYVELDGENAGAATFTAEPAKTLPPPLPAVESAPPAGPAGGGAPTATTLYDYEANEDNELTFPEGVKITNIAFPAEDWWSGEYGGQEGLFPASYVQLDE